MPDLIGFVNHIVPHKGEHWHCPYCQCSWGYGGRSENERLKRELEAERKRKENALADANWLRESMAEQEKLANRLKKRISRGVCPCCNRTFSQLAKHMKNQHPEFPA